MLYFLRHEVRVPGGSPIKIGYTEDAERLAGRMRHYQTAVPWKICGLATCNGGRALESRLHKAFKGSRIQGTREWFAPVPELTTLIQWLRDNPGADPRDIEAMADACVEVVAPPKRKHKTVREVRRNAFRRQIEDGLIKVYRDNPALDSGDEVQ